MSGEYTAGPWDSYDDSVPDHEKWVIGDGASVYSQICVVEGEHAKANARLIRAAPELLEFLEAVMELEANNALDMLADHGADVIAKATGSEVRG